MAEHHSGTVNLTGQAQPDQPTPEAPGDETAPDVEIEMTPEHTAAIVNIWMKAGREVDAYATAHGWGHHPTIDMLRNGPDVAVFYDAAFHGSPDITAEEVAKNDEESGVGVFEDDTQELTAEDMLAEIANVDPALAEMLGGILKHAEAKPE